MEALLTADKRQLAFDFMLPPPPAPTPIADALIAAGLAPNNFILNLNRGPWNDDSPAPSRLYNHPLEYFEPGRDGDEGIFLLHPALADMPFVKRVADVIGRPVEHREEDEFGRPLNYLAKWWHAVDLMTDNHWQHLMQTQHLTERECLLNALAFNLELANIKVETARTVLNALEQPEPADRSQSMILGDGISPWLIDINCNTGKPIKKPKQWALNIGRFDDAAWMVIHAIENGWFVRLRNGRLSLTEKAVDARAKAEVEK